MKNFIIATVRATFYNVERHTPVAPTTPVDDWENTPIEFKTTYENVVEEFVSFPRRNTLEAIADAKAQAEEAARFYQSFYDTEELPTKVVSVYEAEDLNKLQERIHTDNWSLLEDLVPGQEIKSKTKTIWATDPVANRPYRQSYTVYYDGDINPNYLTEEGTGKWYYVNLDECLFTGDETCKKHTNSHKAVWFK